MATNDGDEFILVGNDATVQAGNLGQRLLQLATEMKQLSQAMDASMGESSANVGAKTTVFQADNLPDMMQALEEMTHEQEHQKKEEEMKGRIAALKVNDEFDEASTTRVVLEVDQSPTWVTSIKGMNDLANTLRQIDLSYKAQCPSSSDSYMLQENFDSQEADVSEDELKFQSEHGSDDFHRVSDLAASFKTLSSKQSYAYVSSRLSSNVERNMIDRSDESCESKISLQEFHDSQSSSSQLGGSGRSSRQEEQCRSISRQQGGSGRGSRQDDDFGRYSHKQGGSGRSSQLEQESRNSSSSRQSSGSRGRSRRRIDSRERSHDKESSKRKKPEHYSSSEEEQLSSGIVSKKDNKPSTRGKICAKSTSRSEGKRVPPPRVSTNRPSRVRRPSSCKSCDGDGDHHTLKRGARKISRVEMSAPQGRVDARAGPSASKSSSTDDFEEVDFECFTPLNIPLVEIFPPSDSRVVDKIDENRRTYHRNRMMEDRDYYVRLTKKIAPQPELLKNLAGKQKTFAIEYLATREACREYLAEKAAQDANTSADWSRSDISICSDDTMLSARSKTLSKSHIVRDIKFRDRVVHCTFGDYRKVRSTLTTCKVTNRDLAHLLADGNWRDANRDLNRFLVSNGIYNSSLAKEFSAYCFARITEDASKAQEDTSLPVTQVSAQSNIDVQAGKQDPPQEKEEFQRGVVSEVTKDLSKKDINAFEVEGDTPKREISSDSEVYFPKYQKDHITREELERTHEANVITPGNGNYEPLEADPPVEGAEVHQDEALLQSAAPLLKSKDLLPKSKLSLSELQTLSDSMPNLSMSTATSKLSLSGRLKSTVRAKPNDLSPSIASQKSTQAAINLSCSSSPQSEILQQAVPGIPKPISAASKVALVKLSDEPKSTVPKFVSAERAVANEVKEQMHERKQAKTQSMSTEERVQRVSEVWVGKAQPTMDLMSSIELSNDTCSDVTDCPEKYIINSPETKIFNPKSKSCYVFRLGAGNIGDLSTDPETMHKKSGYVKALGKCDPYYWKSVKTREFYSKKSERDNEFVYKQRSTKFKARAGSERGSKLQEDVERRIYTLRNNLYVVQYIGDVRKAHIDTRKRWFSDQEEDLKDVLQLSTSVKQLEVPETRADSGEVFQPDMEHVEIDDRVRMPPPKETVRAAPLYEDRHDLLRSMEIEMLLDPARSPDITPAVAGRDVINQCKSGTVYLFDVNQVRGDWREDILVDPLRWNKKENIMRGGVKHIRDVYHMLKGHNRQTDKRFQKHVIYNTHTGRVLVHYTGQDNVRQYVSHGNSKDTDIPFIRRTPHARSAIWDKDLSVPPSKVLHDARSEMQEGLLGAETTTRNMNQVNYERRKMRENLITHADDIETIDIVYQDNKDLVRRTVTNPRRQFTCISQGALEHMSTILHNHEQGDQGHPLLFMYDTTFENGPYYMSVLSVTDPLYYRPTTNRPEVKFSALRGSPQIPIAVNIHERKVGLDHQSFFQDVKYHMDQGTGNHFSACRKVLVSDSEFGEDTWNREGPVVYCWNHLKTNVEFKLRKTDRHARLWPDVEKQLHGLLMSSSEESYQKKLATLSRNVQPWRDPDFKAYFTARIHPKIVQHSGSWILEQLNIPDSKYGLTTNAAEGLNRKFADTKRYLDRIVGSKDYTFQEMAALTRHFLESSDNECILAMHGQGDFRLRPQYKHIQRPIEETPALRSKSMEEMFKEVSEHLASKRHLAPRENRDAFSAREVQEINTLTGNAPIFDDEEEPDGITQMARYYIDHRRIAYNPYFKSYQVMETDGTVHSVCIDKDRPSCTCLQKGICAHYMAASVSAGVVRDADMMAVKRKGKTIPSHPNVPRGHESRSSKRPKRRDHIDDAVIKLPEKKVPAEVNKKASSMINSPSRIESKVPPHSMSATEMSSVQVTGNTTDFDMGVHKDNYPGQSFPHVMAQLKPATTSTPIQGRKTFQLNEILKQLTDPTNQGSNSSKCSGPEDESFQLHLSTTNENTIEELKLNATGDGTMIEEERRRDEVLKTIEEMEEAQNDELSIVHMETLNKRIPYKHISQNSAFQLREGEIQYLEMEGIGMYCEDSSNVYVVDNLHDKTGRAYKYEGPRAWSQKMAANAIRHLSPRSWEIHVHSYTDPNPEHALQRLKEGKKYSAWFIDYETYKKICQCTKVVKVREEKLLRHTWDCSKCKMEYHHECTGHSFHPKECGMCTVPSGFKGLKWAEGSVTNTCCIDNELTAIALKCQQNEMFAEAVMTFPYNDDETSAYVCDVVQELKRGRWGKAQETWNALRLAYQRDHFPKLKPNLKSLHGNPHSMFYDPIHEAGQVEYSLKCQNCSASVCDTATISKFMPCSNSEKMCDVPLNAISNPNTTFHNRKCTTCTHTVLIPDKPLECEGWFWHLDLETTPYTYEEALTLPKAIFIGSEKFDLANVTFHREKEDHFISLLHNDGVLMSYDGSRPERITSTDPSHFRINYEDMKITGCTYLKDFNHSVMRSIKQKFNE